MAPECPTGELLDWLRDYAARKIHSGLMDERRSIAPHFVLDMGNRGLLGMQVPREHGGRLGLNNAQLFKIQRQLGAIDLSLAFFVGLNNGLGVRPILRFAQPHIQQRYLPELAAGRMLGAFAITEPGAGSNPLALTARAQRGAQGFALTGSKLWCGSAAWAGVISVFAQHVDAEARPVGHVGLCVDADQPGMRVGAEAMTMGMRAMVQNTVYFDQALVAPDRVLGSPYAGLSVASDVMGFGRLGIAATAIGGLWRALQYMLRYSTRRTINTGSLYAHGHGQRVIGDTWMAARLLGRFVDNIAQALDRGAAPPSELHAAAKLLASEALWQGADAAMQMLGGRGYCENNGVAQLLRDARITRLFEGPSETLASYIGQRVWQSRGNHLAGYFTHCGAPGLRAAQQLQTLMDRLGEATAGDSDAAPGALLVPLGHSLAWLLVQASTHDPEAGEAAWLQHQCDAAAARTLAFKQCVAVPTAERLAQEVALYIGDIEQGAAGADHELDSYLRQHPATA